MHVGRILKWGPEFGVLLSTPDSAFTLTEIKTDTDTEKNGSYRIVWRCSYYMETALPLGTVTVLSPSVSVSVSVYVC